MDLKKTCDFDLMAMVKDGRQEAFVELIHRYQRSLLNFFRKMGADMNEAEDLTQETFLRLFGYRTRYRPLARFTTFLYTLARHAWADCLRKVQRSPQADRELYAESSVSDDRNDAYTDDHIDLQAALGQLSDKLRLVVVMSVYQGLRYNEISEALGIPEGTVKSRMHLAVKQLREILNAKMSA